MYWYRDGDTVSGSLAGAGFDKKRGWIQFQDEVTSAAAGEYLWIGAPESIYRVETDTGAATRLPFELAGVVDFSLDAKRDRMWILQGDGRVAVHRLDGTEIRVFALDEARNEGAAKPAIGARPAAGGVVVDPRNGNAYAAWKNGLHYFNAETETRAVIYLPATVQRIAATPAADRIWAATSRGLYAFDAQGEQVRSIQVDGGFAIDLALNAAADTLLLVLDDPDRTGHVLREYNADGAVVFETRLRDLATVVADGSGGFWATGRRNILHFSDGRRLTCALALRRVQSGPMAVAASPVDRSLWAATEARVVRLDEDCATTRQFAKIDIEVAAMRYDDTDAAPP